MANYKIDRIAEDIRRELTDIMRGLKDPRITGMLSIVKLDLSRDMSTAKVYVSSLSGFESAKTSVEGLKSSAGYVRRELSGRLKIRHTPEIIFIADDSIEYSAMINKKLHDLGADK